MAFSCRPSSVIILALKQAGTSKIRTSGVVGVRLCKAVLPGAGVLVIVLPSTGTSLLACAFFVRKCITSVVQQARSFTNYLIGKFKVDAPIGVPSFVGHYFLIEELQLGQLGGNVLRKAEFDALFAHLGVEYNLSLWVNA